MDQKIKEGFDKNLWEAAKKLRLHMDVSEYKYVVLVLIFIKYISDSFDENWNQVKEKGICEEDKRLICEQNHVFYVSPKARWSYIESYINSDDIGDVIDKAMKIIENDNPPLRGLLTKKFSVSDLEPSRLSEIVSLFGNVNTSLFEKDVLGYVYEFFLTKFNSHEGKLGGEYYTPPCIVNTLVEMIEPFKGILYDPCCGTGRMFCQRNIFMGENNKRDVFIYGQESNPIAWRLAKMNLIVRGLNANLGEGNKDTFSYDQYQQLKADYILSNPPFNMSDWGGENLQEDKRWKYGIPPVRNANFAWVQHIISHMKDENGVAGIVLANGALSSNKTNEGEIRKNIVKEDLVECIVILPRQLFSSTGISVSLWILRKKKSEETKNKILFIDAGNLGTMLDKKTRILSEEDIKKISSIYHTWMKQKDYQNITGFCKEATLSEVEEQGYNLMPGRYVGVEAKLLDEYALRDNMKQLTDDLAKLFEQSHKYEKELLTNLADYDKQKESKRWILKK